MVFSFPWDREILISSFQLIPQSFLFIHLWWFWRWIFVKICKIHWKLMIFKSQYCFANISATKAPIVMKFETSIHKKVKNYQKKNRKDPCKTILTFKNDQFSMYFAYFHSFAPLKSSKTGNYWMSMEFYGD